MSSIDQQMDEEMYKETTIIHKRHLTDAVLREPLEHVKSPEAVDVSPEATIQAVLETMKEKRSGAVLVCEPESRKLVGIFTERDLLLRVAGQGWRYEEHQIKEVMTPDPDCLTPRDKVGFALQMMMNHGYRHIPIIRRSGKPYGLISVRDLLHYLSEYFPEDVLNLPPEPKQIPSTREGG